MSPAVLDAADFEVAKQMARSADPAVRRQVARHPATRPELLYFLAVDDALEVRQAIAHHSGTPRQADLLLAADRAEAVRGTVARKVSGLLPGLTGEKLAQVERLTLECLEKLAQDQARSVRLILAESLKDLPNVPLSLINRLARDVELSVCAPILRHSPIITDADLLDIILQGPVVGSLSAIAGRKQISAPIADAIVNSDDEAAVAVLLSNASAQIREETLDRILDAAPRHVGWHAPLVRRPRLPPGAIARLASFVADNLLKVLQDRDDLGPEAARALAEGVRRRVGGDQEHGHTSVDGDELGVERERRVAMARKLAKDGKLDEPFLEQALAAGDRSLVAAGVAELAKLPLETVDNILAANAARAMVALSWRAGLSMRFALQAQVQLAQIPPHSTLTARGKGGYPMSDDEMRWQLAFFGVD